MDIWLAHGHFATIMAALLCASAGFSASETALFSLSRIDLRHLRERPGRAASCILRLLERPRDLIVLILIGNLFVNMFYFTLATVIATRAAATHGTSGLFIVEIPAIACLILFGEITPKLVAMRLAMPVARLAAPPLTVLQSLLRPLLNAASRIVESISAAFLPRHKDRFITEDELLQLMRISESAGVITGDERELFSDVILLSKVRVKEIMRPRPELAVLTVSEKAAPEIVERAYAARQPVLPVRGAGIDDIRGVVSLRDLVVNPDASPAELLKPARYIPEIKHVDSLLREFVAEQRTYALAVDEYGGFAGLITFDDIVAEIFGSLEPESPRADLGIAKLKKDVYEIGGRAALRELEYLGIDLEPTGLSTVGGFVSAELGASPTVNDVVTYQNLRFTVLAVSKRRILKVRLEIG